MKVVIIFYSIFEIINGIYSIYSQPLDDNSIIQYSDDYYKKHSQENLDDLNLKIKDRLRKHNTIKTNSNRIKPNTNNRKNNFESNSKIEEQIDKIDIEFVDMIVKEREVKLFISGENACNVKVEDKILYEQHEKNSHFLEHLILNSNYDYITPENLKSDDIQIDFLSFNRKLNLFSVFYENPKNLTQYSIEYDYMAVNLIKTYKSYNLTNEENVLNYIIWKFYNENSVNIKQKLRIIFHFELGKNFEKENVAFFRNNNNSTMNFEKKILKNLNTPRQTVLYEWNGFINPNEVIVLDAKFPLYFDNCQLVKISVPIIVAGFYQTLKEEDRMKFFGIPYLKNDKTLENSNTYIDSNKESNTTYGSFMKENKSKAYGIWKHILIPYDSKWKQILDFIVLILNFITCVIVIYETSITNGKTFHITLYIFELIFLVSIILNFFHEYQNPETLEVIHSYKEIAYNYMLHGWFFIDIISIFPYEFIITHDLSFIKLIRIIRMAKLVDVIEHSIFENIIVTIFSSNKNDRIRILNNIRFIYKILRLITIAIMMTYFIGCIWYLFCDKMSAYYGNEDFITVYNLKSLTDIERLVISCYFALTTLTTVGYGDYVAKNNAERILAIFIMLLGVGMFSYIMGNLNELISSHDKNTCDKDKTPDLHNWLTLLQKFTKKPFNPELIKKIDKHFIYYWENDRNSSISKNDPYLVSLPKSMKIKVMEFLWGDILNKFSNFFLYYGGNREKFHKFYYDISYLFQPRFFNPNDIIYKANEECEEMYFILEGIVELGYKIHTQSKEKMKFVKDMKSFDCIGDFYCLFNIRSRYYYRANSEIKAYAINKYELLKALDECEELFNKYRSRSYRKYKDNIKDIMENNIKEDIKNSTDVIEGRNLLSNVNENLPNQNSPVKKINKLFSSKLRKHKKEIKNLNIEIDKKCIKLDDDYMNLSKKFFDVSGLIEKEIFNLNSELEEIRYKLDRNK